MNMSKPLFAALIFASVALGSNVSAQDSEITISTKSYGDWQVRCEQQKGADKVCVMTQQALVQESGQRLMQANIAKQDGTTKMTLILPLGIYLPAGAALQLDEKKHSDLTVVFCTQAGCFVNLDLDKGLRDSISGAESAAISLQPTDGQTVNVPLSVNGFADAHDAL